MKIYEITGIGKRALKSGTLSGDQQKALQHIKDTHAASDESIDVVADRWVVRQLEKAGLIKELK